MPILCIHNPVMHKDPQTYYRVEVGFTKLHTCPQAAHHQTIEALAGRNPFALLNMGAGWQHYRPSRVGPVLRLPAAKGNRKVTVLVWLEESVPVAPRATFTEAEKVMQGQQIFNQSELTLIKEAFETQNIWVDGDNEVAKQVYTKAAKLLKGTK